MSVRALPARALDCSWPNRSAAPTPGGAAGGSQTASGRLRAPLRRGGGGLRGGREAAHSRGAQTRRKAVSLILCGVSRACDAGPPLVWGEDLLDDLPCRGWSHSDTARIRTSHLFVWRRLRKRRSGRGSLCSRRRGAGVRARLDGACGRAGQFAGPRSGAKSRWAPHVVLTACWGRACIRIGPNKLRGRLPGGATIARFYGRSAVVRSAVARSPSDLALGG